MQADLPVGFHVSYLKFSSALPRTPTVLKHNVDSRGRTASYLKVYINFNLELCYAKPLRGILHLRADLPSRRMLLHIELSLADDSDHPLVLLVLIGMDARIRIHQQVGQLLFS